ncbi:urease accessory protein UreF [soil metagenome]
MKAQSDSALLQLLQFADSTLPIGAQAHSFGLETLTVEGMLTVDSIEPFLQDYVFEIGAIDALFCRAAYRLATEPDVDLFEAEWLTLNCQLSSLRMARESRAASATLGRRFLTLAAGLTQEARMQLAQQSAKQASIDLHYVTAFGLVGGLLGLDEEATTLACLQQSLTSLLSAMQKLLPIGQSQVVSILWALKPALIAAADRGRHADWRDTGIPSFGLLTEIAAMRHATLPVRLFIS